MMIKMEQNHSNNEGDTAVDESCNFLSQFLVGSSRFRFSLNENINARSSRGHEANDLYRLFSHDVRNLF